MCTCSFLSLPVSSQAHANRPTRRRWVYIAGVFSMPLVVAIAGHVCCLLHHRRVLPPSFPSDVGDSSGSEGDDAALNQGVNEHYVPHVHLVQEKGGPKAAHPTRPRNQDPVGTPPGATVGTPLPPDHLCQSYINRCLWASGSSVSESGGSNLCAHALTAATEPRGRRRGTRSSSMTMGSFSLV